MANAPERVVNGIKTRVLHGKDYVEVAERVRVLHQVSDDVEMVESGPLLVADHLLWRVAIRRNGKLFIGHAEVKLNASKNTPDGTNPFECAETSAYGRAIANAGLGTVDSIASYDEIARSQPTRVIEQPQQAQIEAHATTAPPSLKELFRDGKEAAMWTTTEEFTTQISLLLNIEATKDTVLTFEQREVLASIIAEQQPVPATA